MDRLGLNDRLDEAAKLLDAAYDSNDGELFDAKTCAVMASVQIQLWHAERIRKFEQAQEEWQRKQRENTPPPPMMPHPGYVGF